MAIAWLLVFVAISFVGELSLGAPLASPGHTKREADDVSVSSEVMMEALFYDLDDLQDQLEQCEEQVSGRTAHGVHLPECLWNLTFCTQCHADLSMPNPWQLF